jgi:putative transposase
LKTFLLAVKTRPQYAQLLRREGRRKAYSREPFHLELELTTRRHGDRPFEIAHVDHTELDVELVCSRIGRNLGRPWLTLLLDAFSRRILSVYVTFDPPSYRSCMMALRICVMRHGRLPQTIVTDGGKEFASVYFQSLLAAYECTRKTRPPAEAFAAGLERGGERLHRRVAYDDGFKMLTLPT